MQPATVKQGGTGRADGGNLLPPGAIDFFAMSSPPTGYLKANGAAISRTAYAALYAAIGTTFGAGDGSTTFNLPDLRGQFIRSWADNGTTDSGRTFGSLQAQLVQNHYHLMPIGYNGTNIFFWKDTNNGPAFGSNIITNQNYMNIGSATNTSGGIQIGWTQDVVNTTGSGNETRPTNVALLACIKY